MNSHQQAGRQPLNILDSIESNQSGVSNPADPVSGAAAPLLVPPLFSCHSSLVTTAAALLLERTRPHDFSVLRGRSRVCGKSRVR